MKKAWSGILFILLLTGCTSPSGPEEPSFSSNETYTGIFGAYAKAHDISMEEAQAFFAQNYGLERESQIFELLEPAPENYLEEKSWLYDGNSESVKWISRETYERPEFYPTFQTSGVQSWVNAPGIYPFSIGILATPSQQETVLETGQEFDSLLFVGASWGVTTRQAVKLYFDVEPQANITVITDPNPFFLEKNFPQFEKGWVKRIAIQGKIGEDVKPGQYTITIRTKELEPNEGVAGYYPANSAFTSEEGIAVLNITVKP